jgi:hypothetical protein
MDEKVVHLPAIPIQSNYDNEYRWREALQAWEVVCKGAVRRSNNVQPPPVPIQSQFENEYRFREALEAYKRIFE